MHSEQRKIKIKYNKRGRYNVAQIANQVYRVKSSTDVVSILVEMIRSLLTI